MNIVIETWKDSLSHLLLFYEAKRGRFFTFFPKLFLFFVVINILCYWWAMFTAFPDLTDGSTGPYYFKVQFPVGFLGAFFDSLSFFITIIIVRRALRSQNGVEYVGHLSLDLVIAILASLWVYFVFVFSGWLIHHIEATPQDIVARSGRYEGMVVNAIANPYANKRNIYFGVIMGVSAMIPTCIHLYMFFRASLNRITVLVRARGF